MIHFLFGERMTTAFNKDVLFKKKKKTKKNRKERSKLDLILITLDKR